MLVEDDKSLREIYSIRLVAEGYDIVSANDGEDALAQIVKERPDLVVSDVMMPKISGFDMLDIIRSTPEVKDTKVIMMTALGSEDQRQRGESLGANRYLVKSQVGIEDVVNVVHEVLGDKVAAPAGIPATAPALAAAQPQPAQAVLTPSNIQAAAVAAQAAPAPAAPAPQPTPAPMPAPVAPVAPAVPTPVATAAPPAPAPMPVQPAPAPEPQPVPTTPPAAPAPEPVAAPPAPAPAPAAPKIGEKVIQPIANPEADAKQEEMAKKIQEELSNEIDALNGTPTQPAPAVPTVAAPQPTVQPIAPPVTAPLPAPQPAASPVEPTAPPTTNLSGAQPFDTTAGQPPAAPAA